MSYYVVNRQFLSQVGQPLANLTIAVLIGNIGAGSGNANTSTQPGSVLATVYADPLGTQGILTNPTTPGTNTLTTDGSGNLCSAIQTDSGIVYTLGIYLNTSGYGASTQFVLQVYGAGIIGQQLIPITFPSGGGGS